MRVARVLHHDTERAARVGPDGDSLTLFPPGVTTIDVITSDQRAIEEVALAEIRLPAPIDPPTIRDFSVFEQHMEGVRKAFNPNPSVPEVFYASPFCYFSNPMR